MAARDIKLTVIEIPADANVSYQAASDHGNVRRHLWDQRKITLPDMILIDVFPGLVEGSWRIDVWESPDD